MIKRLIVSALLVLALTATPVLAGDVEQESFEAAQAAFLKINEDMVAGMKLYGQDNLTGPVISKTLNDDLVALDDIVVYECFSKWYSLRYGVATILASVVIDMITTNSLAQYATTIVNTAGFLDSLATKEFANIDCDAPVSQ